MLSKVFVPAHRARAIALMAVQQGTLQEISWDQDRGTQYVTPTERGSFLPWNHISDKAEEHDPEQMSVKDWILQALPTNGHCTVSIGV